MYETVSTTTRGRILLRMAAASAPATASASKPDRTHYLYLSVIAAVVLGIVVGLVAPALGKAVQPLGTAFIALIKMMISPIIFCTIVLGIGKIRKAAQVGKVGAIALGYFVAMSTIALAIGLLVGNIIQPGAGLRVEGLAHYQVPAAKGTGDFLLGIIPTTLFSPLTGDNVLSTLFVALLVGFALQAMGRTGEPVLRALGYVEKLVFRVLSMIMWAAPIGAFGAIAAVVGGAGWAALGALASVMVGFYITCALFVIIVLGTVLRVVTGLNILKLLRYLGREFLLIVSTSSSESALPRLIAKMEHVGVSRPVVGITVPTGYSFNLDGTAIYLTMASLFVADAHGQAARARRADRPARLHDHRFEGRGGRQRRGPRDPRGWPRFAPSRPGRRRGPDRRHRPVHVRGARGHQLRGQRRRHAADRPLGRRVRQGPGRPRARR